MLRIITTNIRRFRYQLEDLRYALDYPNIMFRKPPKNCDIRGEYEMDIHWANEAKLLAKRKQILDANNDPDKAGWQPYSLELFNE